MGCAMQEEIKTEKSSIDVKQEINNITNTTTSSTAVKNLPNLIDNKNLIIINNSSSTSTSINNLIINQSDMMTNSSSILIKTSSSGTAPLSAISISAATTAAVNSQNLKKQHSALVKLLESAPITKNEQQHENTINKSSPIIMENINLKNLSLKKCTQQQNLGTFSYRKRLKSMTDDRNINPNCNINSNNNNINLNLKSNLKLINETNKLINTQVAICQNNNNNKNCDDNLKTTFKDDNNKISINNIKINNYESGIDEDDSDNLSNPDEFVQNQQQQSQQQHQNQHNQQKFICPWKKIRYGREWKQRNNNNICKNSNFNNDETQIDINLNKTILICDKNIEDKAEQHKIINNKMIICEETDHQLQHQQNNNYYLYQQHQQNCRRRDSSDSNSSSLSNSSQCTCLSSLNLNNSNNKCYCNNCHQLYDSGCDDEQCENYIINNNNDDDDQLLLDGGNCNCESMNLLCKKFNENLKSNDNNNHTTAISLTNNNSGSGSSAPANNDSNNGFFRRSIQQKIQYRPCTKNQQCSILRINRNRCQYCRLKKCIAVGMSRDAVRFGRVPKREKARILAAMQQSTQNRGQQRQLATELDDQPRLLAAVLRAHMETCEFTKEKVTAMRQRARECPSYSMPTLLACPLNPAPELQSEQEFSERFAHVIRGVIDFAGMIPGFQLLNQDDKFTLLKAGLFDALFVRLICMFDSSINSIICLNGQVMRRDAIQNGANARFLVDSTFNFAERMNSMNLTDAEIGLFCAIVLITPDRPGLRNIELIDKMYSRLKGCLQSIINQNRPDQPDFMSELLKTMPDLRTLSTLHTEKLVVFRTEHKELLRQQMWQMDDDQPSKSPGSSSAWDDRDRLIMDDVAKSPLGSVSSTESGDIEYSHHHHNHTTHHHHHNQPAQGSSSSSSLASSAPLLAATLSGTCPLRNRANSGSSAEDVDIVVGSHAHLTQNGLTITPVARSSQLLHHHLNGQRHPYRKLDSPTDSGIESGNEKAESTKTVSSGGGSSCSSPRSCVDDAMDAEATPTQPSNGSNNNNQIQVVNQHQQNSTSTTIMNVNGATKRQIVEDMPVLKRVLQAPPLYDTNSLMDEAYKPHKKFRALRHRDYDAAEADATTTSSTVTPSSQSPVMGNSSNNNNNSCSSQTNIPHVQQQQQHHHHHQQSQLHMHLTRNTNTTTATNNNNINYHNHHNNSQSPQQQQQQQQQQPQQQHSSLSSTHSVLAKSLMAEPRMTPEQMKRSDIIQNYIMRDQPSQQVNSSSSNNGSRDNSSSNNNSNGLLVCAAASSNSLSCPYSPSTVVIPASSTNNSNCLSPSTTTVTLSSPPPPPPSSSVPHSMRWQGHSVITTTTLRQQSISPHSNSSTTSCNSNISNNNNNSNNSNSNMSSNYFQAPHSTSVSPPRPSPSSAHSPRLLELQVDIADSQQPLNLSKKSPTPPPQQQQQQLPQSQVSIIGTQKSSSINKYPIVAPDVTVTPSNGTSSSAIAATVTPTVGTTIHKVLLEA